MSRWQKTVLFLLRISLGWLFLYSGITKVLNPNWTSAGFLKSAKTFPEFYQWLASGSVLPVVDILNQWGMALLGVSLILGVFVRLSSFLGAILMMLYYFPRLVFPHPDANSFIVDQHVIYASALLLLGAFRAGRVMGLENWCSKLPVCLKYPRLRKFFG